MQVIRRPGFYAEQSPVTRRFLEAIAHYPIHVLEQAINVMRYEGEIPTDAEMIRWMTRNERREEAERRGLVVVR